MADESVLLCEAFRQEIVLQNFNKKIESLFPWNDTLLLGLQDGTILTLRQPSTINDVSASPASEKLKSSPPLSSYPSQTSVSESSTADSAETDIHRPRNTSSVDEVSSKFKARSESESGAKSSPAHPPFQSSTGQPPPTWEVIKGGYNRSTRRKAIKQLEVVTTAATRTMLLTLADDGISLYTMPEMDLRFQALGTAGATVFAWNASKNMLAVGVRRRVMLFTLRHSDLEQAGDMAVPDTATCMAWAGDSCVVLGLRCGDYVTLNPNTNQVSEPFERSFPTGVETSYTFGYRQALDTLVTVSPASREVMLLRDWATTFYTADGEPSRQTKKNRHAGALGWSGVPLKVVATAHHAVAVLPGGHIEIRSTRRGAATNVLQKIQLGSEIRLAAAAPDGSVFIVSHPEKLDGLPGLSPGTWNVTRLVPVTLQEQAVSLASLGEFQEALEVVALIQGDPVGRRMLTNRLRLMFGHHLFNSRDYAAALAEMGQVSGAHPLLLLRLLPSLVAPKFRGYLVHEAFGEQLPQVQEPEGEDLQMAVRLLVPYLQSSRTRLLEARRAVHHTPDQQVAGDGPSAQPYSSTSATKPGSASGASPWSRAQSSSLSDGCATPRSELTVAQSPRTRSPLSSFESPGGAGMLFDEEPRELVVVDSAILRSFVALPDNGGCAKFVQEGNHYIDLEDGVEVLSKAGMYYELVMLYKARDQHSAALALLRVLSEKPDSLAVPPQGYSASFGGQAGVYAAIRYLSLLTEAHAALITEYARWALEHEEDMLVDAFLGMNPPLNPRMVLSILGQHSPAACALYLEEALKKNVAAEKEYHSELLLIYLQEFQLEQDRIAPQPTPPISEPPSHLPRSSSAASLSEYSLSTRKKAPSSVQSDKISDHSVVSIGDSRAARSRPSSPARAGKSEHASAHSTRPHPLATSHTEYLLNTDFEPTSRPSPLERLPLYDRLKKHVMTSKYIDPYHVLSRLPVGGPLSEIRALMLERLGRHREALSVYVHTLRDLKKAEDYCDRVYEALHSGTSTDPANSHPNELVAAADLPRPRTSAVLASSDVDIYFELLMVFLDGDPAAVRVSSGYSSPSRESWRELAGILARKVQRTDVSRILSLLPAGVALGDVMPLMTAALAATTLMRRNLRLTMHLRKSENLQTHEEIVRSRQRRVLITPERACWICNKRIGSAVSVAYAPPSTSLAHYLCFKRREAAVARAGGMTGPPQGLSDEWVLVTHD